MNIVPICLQQSSYRERESGSAIRSILLGGPAEGEKGVACAAHSLLNHTLMNVSEEVLGRAVQGCVRTPTDCQSNGRPSG